MQKQRSRCGEMTASAADYDSNLLTKRTEPKLGATGMKEKKKESPRANLQILDRVIHESERVLCDTKSFQKSSHARRDGRNITITYVNMKNYRMGF